MTRINHKHNIASDQAQYYTVNIMTGKNIVICCDGTGNEYGENNTNVVRTAEICIRNDQQLIYYDPGVGTGGFNYGKIRQMAGGATGKGLQKNIEDAYSFLMKTYQPGDRIYLFGFSRGAVHSKITGRNAIQHRAAL